MILAVRPAAGLAGRPLDTGHPSPQSTTCWQAVLGEVVWGIA